MITATAAAAALLFPGAGGAVVYGQDDRREPDEVVGDAVASAVQATALVIDPSRLSPSPGGGWDIDVASFGTFSDYVEASEGFPLCESEPYRDQPVPGYCSGFLVGPSLVATAGHCVGASCSGERFVFGFRMVGGAPVTHVGDDDVFACAAIVDRAQTATLDYAVVQLDRAVPGRTPLPLRRVGAVESDPDVAGLLDAGHPSGIPIKIIGGPIALPGLSLGAAEVKDAQPDYFESNLDVYAGNSGSVVFSVDPGGGFLFAEGILVRGNADWVQGAGCLESRECPDETGCPSEGWSEATRATAFAASVPEPVPASGAWGAAGLAALLGAAGLARAKGREAEGRVRSGGPDATHAGRD